MDAVPQVPHDDDRAQVLASQARALSAARNLIGLHDQESSVNQYHSAVSGVGRSEQGPGSHGRAAERAHGGAGDDGGRPGGGKAWEDALSHSNGAAKAVRFQVPDLDGGGFLGEQGEEEPVARVPVEVQLEGFGLQLDGFRLDGFLLASTEALTTLSIGEVTLKGTLHGLARLYLMPKEDLVCSLAPILSYVEDKEGPLAASKLVGALLKSTVSQESVDCQGKSPCKGAAAFVRGRGQNKGYFVVRLKAPGSKKKMDRQPLQQEQPQEQEEEESQELQDEENDPKEQLYTALLTSRNPSVRDMFPASTHERLRQAILQLTEVTVPASSKDAYVIKKKDGDRPMRLLHNVADFLRGEVDKMAGGGNTPPGGGAAQAKATGPKRFQPEADGGAPSIQPPAKRRAGNRRSAIHEVPSGAEPAGGTAGAAGVAAGDAEGANGGADAASPDQAAAAPERAGAGTGTAAEQAQDQLHGEQQQEQQQQEEEAYVEQQQEQQQALPQQQMLEHEGMHEEALQQPHKQPLQQPPLPQQQQQQQQHAVHPVPPSSPPPSGEASGSQASALESMAASQINEYWDKEYAAARALVAQRREQWEKKRSLDRIDMKGAQQETAAAKKKLEQAQRQLQQAKETKREELKGRREACTLMQKLLLTSLLPGDRERLVADLPGYQARVNEPVRAEAEQVKSAQDELQATEVKLSEKKRAYKGTMAEVGIVLE